MKEKLKGLHDELVQASEVMDKLADHAYVEDIDLWSSLRAAHDALSEATARVQVAAYGDTYQ